MSSADASSFFTSIAHHLESQRAVRNLRGDVHCVVTGAEEVQVLGEGLPGTPRDTFVERAAGNVLDTFHELDERRLLAGGTRREAHAAVAHYEGGHTIAERRIELVVPGGLAVVVGVNVDPTRCHHGAGCVDGAIAVERTADGREDAVVDRYVTGELLGARTVDDRAALDD